MMVERPLELTRGSDLEIDRLMDFDPYLGRTSEKQQQVT